MNIGYLGAGTWGTALASLLANKGYKVKAWDCNLSLLEALRKTRKHPKLSSHEIPRSIVYVTTLEEAIKGADIIVESVTSYGIRDIFEKIHEIHALQKRKLPPIVITSKGIEQKSGLLFPEIALQIFGKKKIACISGPSHAEEVVKNLPTSVVCSSFDKALMEETRRIFNVLNFRVYPNSDIIGVSFGGALKNVIAIACAISDGLNFGDNTKAALITRGLHEMRKLAKVKGANQQTLNGLSGLGDLCVTCLSKLSRNYQFGLLIASGYSKEEAEHKIGMVVEGVYTTVSAYELGRKYRVPIPITEAVYNVLYKGKKPQDEVLSLLKRAIKEEHL